MDRTSTPAPSETTSHSVCIRKTSFTHKKKSTRFYFLLKGKCERRCFWWQASLQRQNPPRHGLRSSITCVGLLLCCPECVVVGFTKCNVSLPPLTYNFQLLVYRLIVCSVSTLTCRYQKYVVCLRVKSTHEHCSTYIHARKHTRTNAQTRK